MLACKLIYRTFLIFAQNLHRNVCCSLLPLVLCLTSCCWWKLRLVEPHVQAIIGNYAVPILEDKQVWGTSDDTRTAYLDSQDVARMALAALRCVPCFMALPLSFLMVHCFTVIKQKQVLPCLCRTLSSIAFLPKPYWANGIEMLHKPALVPLIVIKWVHTRCGCVSTTNHLTYQVHAFVKTATARKICCFRRDETLGKTMTLAGPKAWTVDEVIALCEKYADAEADVSLLNMLHL